MRHLADLFAEVGLLLCAVFSVVAWWRVCGGALCPHDVPTGLVAGGRWHGRGPLRHGADPSGAGTGRHAAYEPDERYEPYEPYGRRGD